MFKSRLIPRIIGAVLLTGALVANAFQIGAVASDGQVVQEAMLGIKIYSGHKVLDDFGGLKSCVVGGSGCFIVVTAFGDITVSSEGLHIQ